MFTKQEDEPQDLMLSTVVDIDSLVPKDHLVRKIDKAIDFSHIYAMTEAYYCHNNGRPAIDPVVLIKIIMLQHVFGIRSVRQAIREIEVNMAYRWFLHFSLTTPIPHYSTVCRNFSERFPSELFEEIFQWVLMTAYEHNLINADTVFIDSTHIKASANKHKLEQKVVKEADGHMTVSFLDEINKDREDHGRKPFSGDGNEGASEKTVKSSTTDPDCGMFIKGEHERQPAYSAHTACDENNFILATVVTAANVNDSRVLDEVFDEVTETFPELDTIAVDAGYKTPAIAKRIIDSGCIPSMPYKRPNGGEDFFRKP